MIRWVLLVVAFASLAMVPTSSSRISFKNHQLYVDGQAQPQLWGAELQYFRLRAGVGPNQPREKVIALWRKALGHMVEAGMNTISFYIPWDFHEYAEGQFDFEGTVDSDGDGRADYPSRDLKTFFRLIEEAGIRRIMVRPGPYINAEWGFLGFGAIPLWLHEQYPETHMRDSRGYMSKLYNYHHPVLLDRTKKWFQALYDEVLEERIGAGKPIVFFQLDNETNYMWQSLYNHDYSELSVQRYRNFLKDKYGSLDELNRNHESTWKNWSEIQPVTKRGHKVTHQDWYRFQDKSIYDYLAILRKYWEDIGVDEHNVLFTLAESYNAAGDGLLPNFEYRNKAGRTGMMTMNLYPKTWDSPVQPLHNSPFKGDHDVKAMDTASDSYLGSEQDWLFGPEIQGGWWLGTTVSRLSRKQTYLSVIGHGLKGTIVYYFHEGNNWQADWSYEQVLPIYERLKAKDEYRNTKKTDLPMVFWDELQTTVDREVILGIPAWAVLSDGSHLYRDHLYFDAPLDQDANPRPHFSLLKEIGQKLIKPHARFLAESRELTDSVVLLKNSQHHVPSKYPAINSVLFNSDRSAGIIGWLLQRGVNARVMHWDLNDREKIFSHKVVIVQDGGHFEAEQSLALKKHIENGGIVVSFLGTSLAEEMGFVLNPTWKKSKGQKVTYLGLDKKRVQWTTQGENAVTYNKPEGCEKLLALEGLVAGLRCSLGRGQFMQFGVAPYNQFNSDMYEHLIEVEEKTKVVRDLNEQIEPSLFLEGDSRVAAFARRAEGQAKLWITIKNGQGRKVQNTIQVSERVLKSTFGKPSRVKMTEVLTGDWRFVDATRPISIQLSKYDSQVYLLEETK